MRYQPVFHNWIIKTLSCFAIPVVEFVHEYLVSVLANYIREKELSCLCKQVKQ